MLEHDVEKAHVKRVAGQGGASYKFKSPARNNVPDRIDLLGLSNATQVLQAEMHTLGVQLSTGALIRISHRILAAAVQFTELKAPGKKPNDKQLREHDRLRGLGFVVNVVDSK